MDVLGDHLERCGPLKDELSSQQIVRDASECIDVGSAVDLLA